nr:MULTISPECIES: fibronectin type III domain-containing protein [Streptomyces]
MSRKRIALACAAVVVGVGSVVIPVAANAGEEEDGLGAACRVADQATVWWASGEVSLANKGDRPVRDWTAEFDVSQGQVTLDNPWAYELRQVGKHVTVKPIADRADVAAKGNRAVKVGINPAGKGIPKITGCRVKGASGGGSDTGTNTSVPADGGSFVKDDTAVHLMWKPPTGGAEVVRYEVFQDGKQVKTVKDTMTDIERLAPATRYAFKVRAVRADGRTTGFSKDIVLTTLAAPGQDKAKPVIPADLEATASGPYQASLRWRAATDDVAVTGYRIYRDGTKVQEADAKATSATVSGLTASTAYRFKVTAVDASGKESDPTREAQATTTAAPDGNGAQGRPRRLRRHHRHEAGRRCHPALPEPRLVRPAGRRPDHHLPGLPERQARPDLHVGHRRPGPAGPDDEGLARGARRLPPRHDVLREDPGAARRRHVGRVLPRADREDRQLTVKTGT